MNIDRFKRAIEIIEEKPDSQVMLKVWQQSNSVSHYSYISSKQEATCGTIACAAGWLALDPEMQAQGLKSGYGGQPEFHFRGEICGVSFRALGLFFDILDIDADKLFGPRVGWEESGDMDCWTDKQIWLHRAKTFLAGYEGEI
jgi:hypothetical protein